jgi:hypothetical protein
VFEKIVVAVDGSPASEKALAVASVVGEIEGLREGAEGHFPGTLRAESCPRGEPSPARRPVPLLLPLSLRVDCRWGPPGRGRRNRPGGSGRRADPFRPETATFRRRDCRPTARDAGASLECGASRRFGIFTF